MYKEPIKWIIIAGTTPLAPKTTSDEQSDELYAHSSSTSLDKCFVDDLQQMYQDDERSLRRVWQSLGLPIDENPHMLRANITYR